MVCHEDFAFSTKETYWDQGTHSIQGKTSRTSDSAALRVSLAVIRLTIDRRLQVRRPMQTKRRRSQNSSPTRSPWCRHTPRLGEAAARSKELHLSKAKTLFVPKRHSAYFHGQSFQSRPCRKRLTDASSKRTLSCSPPAVVICVSHACAQTSLRSNGRSTFSGISMDGSSLL